LNSMSSFGRGREFTGTIQGVKEGSINNTTRPEPLYCIWFGDKYGWVREGLILELG